MIIVRNLIQADWRAESCIVCFTEFHSEALVATCMF